MNETEKDLEDFIQYNIGNFLWIYVSPILIILGTFGNVMSICVLLRPKFRFSTAMFYLTCLSFGDLFTLYTGLLRYWIIKAFDVDVRSFSNASCKIHAFLVYLSLDFTVWVLVTVTIDRFLSVFVPFKARILCTLKRSGLVIAVIIFLLVVKNMHFFWNVELAGSLEIRCGSKPNDFMKDIWHWIDFSTFCFIPFSIMVACNVKIIYEMTSSQRKLGFFRTPTLAPRLSSPLARDAHSDLNAQSMTMLDTTQTSEMLSQETLPRTPSLATKLDSPLTRRSNSDLTVQSITIHDATQTSEMLSREITSQMTSRQTSRQTSKVKNRSPARRISTLTVMLLTVNGVFLITTSPIMVFLIGQTYWFSDETQEEIAWQNFWWAVVNILQYINNSIHFFLYCLTGQRFRKELRVMLRNHKITIKKGTTRRLLVINNVLNHIRLRFSRVLSN
ncbi:uncharacterized protein LOC132735284 [Ruditapes philippinarum]|uniref:uncharacterized protein LOC132735284 n=1 Tax=Ruditapes philippinarum TaxID=129788 RepID=UPI00295BCEEC|nr:uncharacterized protein LOC132735284 [Ruditapes philippinarum]